MVEWGGEDKWFMQNISNIFLLAMSITILTKNYMMARKNPNDPQRKGYKKDHRREYYCSI
jgi:hypothetical protein